MSKVIKAIRGLDALPLDGDSELAVDWGMPGLAFSNPL